MRTLIYHGPHDAVDIDAVPDPVKRGESFEAPDDVADSLLAQGPEYFSEVSLIDETPKRAPRAPEEKS